MKRIICLLLAVVILATGVLALSSCKNKSEVPEGMQLVRGGSEYGYNLYAPEEWTVSNRGEIACAYVSKLDSTSIIFVKSEAPSAEGMTRAEATVAYFDAEMAKLPFPLTVDLHGEAAEFGNAREAYKFTYSYEYNDTTVGVMQILVYNGDDFYIFTYTSFHEEKEYGLTNYEFYLEKLGTVISTFEFIDKSGEPAKPEYERDADGWLIVSERKVAGFVLHLPESYAVDYSSGIVSATDGDGRNITMSKATYTGVDKDSYWEQRKKDLEPFVDKVKDADGKESSSLSEVEGGISVAVNIDGAKWAYSYEYTFLREGVKYHVYQVLIVKGMNGFVYTYTSAEDNFATGIDTAKEILHKIEY